MPYKPTGRPPGRPRRSIPLDDGEKPVLRQRQWRALREEVRPFLHGTPVLPYFVQRTVGVAAAAKVAQRTAQRWRRDKCYQRGFRWVVNETIIHLQNLCISKGNLPVILHRQRILELNAWLADHWRGPVKSPLDGQIYTSSEAYAAHLVNSRAYDPEWRSW